jgi:hypothetical protein
VVDADEQDSESEQEQIIQQKPNKNAKEPKQE